MMSIENSETFFRIIVLIFELGLFLGLLFIAILLIRGGYFDIHIRYGRANKTNMSLKLGDTKDKYRTGEDKYEK